jgi:hypothetical protein
MKSRPFASRAEAEMTHAFFYRDFSLAIQKYPKAYKLARDKMRKHALNWRAIVAISRN